MGVELDTDVTVHAAYYQYYFYGGDCDTSSVDRVDDGILAPGASRVRIATGAHTEDVELTLRVESSDSAAVRSGGHRGRVQH